MAAVRDATSASDYLAALEAGPAGADPGAAVCACAEALFASVVQPAESPSADQIRCAVTTMLQQLGVSGCAARVAGEFGDHPDTAVPRMRWALTAITTICPASTADGDPPASSDT